MTAIDYNLDRVNFDLLLQKDKLTVNPVKFNFSEGNVLLKAEINVGKTSEWLLNVQGDDIQLGKHFKQQESFATIFLYLTMLAIFIAILGLYGLASYTTEQRTKEIGIRKVMGASVSQLMKMLTFEFVKLVLLANLIAWPISMLLAKNWLSRFSYQIDMPYTPYFLATVIALLIAVLTVSSQAYQASISDPVKALKYE